MMCRLQRSDSDVRDITVGMDSWESDEILFHLDYIF